MRLVVMMVAVLGLSGLALAQPFGETRRYFGDWLAACRPDGYCSATAYDNPQPGNGTVADYVLRIGRQATQPYWEISFSTVATMADGWQDFVVSVDGVAETFGPRSEVGAYQSINDFFLLGPKAQAVMDRLAPGTQMDIAFTDTNGAGQKAQFSLRGLTAALLWIDEQQSRIGSERVALVPPYGLVPVGEEQLATPQIPVDLLDRRADDPECRPLADIANGRDFIVAPLGGGSLLYVLPCDSFAYNFSSKVYVEREDAFTPVYFAEFSEMTGWTGTSVLFGADFDQESQTLTSFYKGRGLGDCGSTGQWRWDGANFVMVEFRAKDSCDGEAGGEVGDFPVVYSATPQR